MAYVPLVREIRDRHVDRAAPPASTAIQVGALLRPGYLVEIDALAAVQEAAAEQSADAT
jgi:enamine deaminase RidA (YjgF/YER057c/UK114 family)